MVGHVTGSVERGYIKGFVREEFFLFLRYFCERYNANANGKLSIDRYGRLIDYAMSMMTMMMI